jgi:hypothetical protein
VLRVRKLVRSLNNLMFWTTESVRVILRIELGEAQAVVRALAAANLAVAEPERGVDVWRTTQLAQTFGSATAAKPIKRETATRALSQLMDRVNGVNTDAHFLARVTKVVVLGSYLRPEVDPTSRSSCNRSGETGTLRAQTQEHVEQLRTVGQRFKTWLEAEYWWHIEAFKFIKGQSWIISLIDYKAEREFVDKVPHRILFSVFSAQDDGTLRGERTHVRRRRRALRSCPF